MGVTNYSQEIICPVAPSRMFKALILDSRTLIPKLLPQFIKNVDILQGGGGPGSIEQVNFAQGSQFNYVKNRIDEVDEQNYVCKYVMIEGDALGDKLEYIEYEIKFEDSSNGGCVCKMTSNYHGIGDFEVKEEEIKAGKDGAMVIYKIVEAYLIENPHKPRVTEIRVRMDCNGCVQKIKKALHGIIGIYELYIDFPQQKITIIGWADPEKIVKAIKKTRKSAIICSHTEPPDPQAQPPESATQGDEAPASDSANPPPSESANPPPSDGPPAEGAPPQDPSPAENSKPETKPSPDAAEASASKPVQPSEQKDVEEVHVIYHHPPAPDYGYRYGYNPSMDSQNMGQGNNCHWQSHRTSPGFRPEPPPPTYVTHSYNTYRASPYVTGYEYIRPPPQYTHFIRPESYLQPQYTHYSRPESYPQPQYTHYSRPESYPQPQYTHYSRPESYPQPQYTYYSRPEHYSEDYYHGNNGNGNITSVFSDENPDGCRIV
ncbi:hypothetical protein ACH5RR_031058 [Cinchona calisaya]|uniref:HMA domain-containing protein n=1 Tax=Cinchona calisaya TaxID=153742 RepID=A0ABD2YG41_9GENT